MNLDFGKMIINKQLKFATTSTANFQSDRHAINFFGYLFNTTEKHRNSRSQINAYYIPNEEILLRDEFLSGGKDRTVIQEVRNIGYERVDNLLVYTDILSYCMQNNISSASEILSVLKDFSDYAVKTFLRVNAIICAYHFNQEEPHLHIVFTRDKHSTDKEEDEDF